MTEFPNIDGAVGRLRDSRMYRAEGEVVRVSGLAVESRGPACSVGEECLLLDRSGNLMCRAEVVGFTGSRVYTMPIDHVQGLTVGSRVVALGRRPQIGVGPQLLGRVLDANGQPLDGSRVPTLPAAYPLVAPPPPALKRERITRPFVTGVRAFDAMMPIGTGQRLGIFAGSGVGKSTLLGMIARHSEIDVAVLALVGERGREVREFIEQELGPEGLKRAVVFVATSDEPPLRRIRAAYAATAAAEYFRDQGRQVVLLMDSITRVAMAQREVGLSAGEPPSTKGYPPSVLSLLPRLVERAGAVEGSGSITGFYSVYVEGDDMNEPVADAARSLLDGHAVLSRDLAGRGQYPAVDLLNSVSRVMPQVADKEHQALARTLRGRLAALHDAEDLLMLGAYRDGTNPEVDAARRAQAQIRSLLVQQHDEGSTREDSLELLKQAVAAGNEVSA